MVFPDAAAQVVKILRLANEYLFPVTARGGGVGYTGGAVPVDGGIVVGTDRMNRIVRSMPMTSMRFAGPACGRLSSNRQLKKGV